MLSTGYQKKFKHFRDSGPGEEHSKSRGRWQASDVQRSRITNKAKKILESTFRPEKFFIVSAHFQLVPLIDIQQTIL